MAIQGNGYFMLGDATGITYTRDGSFSLDNSGNLVNANGAYVLGWSADASGKVDTTAADHSGIAPDHPRGRPAGDRPDHQHHLRRQPERRHGTGATAAYTRTVKVYDSLGEAQNVTLAFHRRLLAAGRSARQRLLVLDLDRPGHRIAGAPAAPANTGNDLLRQRRQRKSRPQARSSLTNTDVRPRHRTSRPTSARSRRSPAPPRRRRPARTAMRRARSSRSASTRPGRSTASSPTATHGRWARSP